MRHPLDRTLNIAVLHIAARLFPNGFDISDQAPETFEELCFLLDSGNRLVVYRGYSNLTIYCDPEVNFAFRAWHDWCHYRGQHPFTFAGERAVYRMQCRQLQEIFGASEKVDRWCDILFAEVIGQHLFKAQTGEFPIDQYAFVRAFLREEPTTVILAAE